MNAVILAGGFGNRLKPLTNNIPKPMLTLYDAPIIDYGINQLYYYGIKDISFSLAYMPEKIIEWILGYKNIKPRFNVEETPLGTCGGVKAIEKHLDKNFFVLSGDGISNINLAEMSEFHHRLNADVTIAVTAMRNPSLYGVVKCDEAGYINYFIEKPQSDIEEGYINCGVYIVNRKILKYVPDSFFDFSKDLFPLMLEKNLKLAAYVHSGYWNDIGSFYNYFASSFYIKDFGKFFPEADNIKRGAYKGFETGEAPRCFINNSASTAGNIHNCIIEANATVASGTVLEKCIVLENADIKKRHTNCILTSNFAIDITEYAQINKFSANYLSENFKF